MTSFLYSVPHSFYSIFSNRYVYLAGLVLVISLLCKAQSNIVSLTVSNALSCSQLSAVITATTSCSSDITYSFRGPNSFSAVNTTGIISVTVDGAFSVTATSADGTCSASNTIAVGSTLHPDYLPLVDFYNSTGGPNWTNKTGWLTNCDPCSNWFGITCTEGRVTGIWFPPNSILGNNLRGTFPSSFGRLAKLKSINLGFESNLTGSLPESISELKELQTLAFMNCGISGTVFDKIIGLTQLENLFLTFTKIIDVIPDNINELANLKYLIFFSNRTAGFRGQLPANLGKLTNLQGLQLPGNLLTGPLPPELGKLSNLEYIYLDDNQLTGNIPPELGNLSNLSDLNLSYNLLTGSLPASLGNLPKLSRLRLIRNKLSGCIPLSFKTLCGKDILIDENLNLPSWTEFCTYGTNNLTSTKDGSWHDPAVWSCGQIPTLKDYVTIQHNVSLPASQAGESRKILFETGGKLNYEAGSTLKISQ